MSRTYDVYGIGNALVDTQHTVKVDFLHRIQIEKGVMTLIDAPRRQALLQAMEGDPVASASGGSAANTAIGVANFGGKAYYACLVGDDSWGDFYLRDMTDAGVECNPTNRTAGQTGQCLVLITPDADRTLNTFLGVSTHIGPAQVEAAVIQESRYIYLEGYLLTGDSGFAACRQAQSFARQGGAAVSLTLSDPFVVDLFKARFQTLIDDGVDLLFCNEDEAKAFAGASTRQEAAQALSRQVGAAYITCGSAGALYCKDGDFEMIPGVAVEAVDTTGAGDLFAGGVLYGLTHGHGPTESAQLGNYAAAQVVSRYGPRLERDLQDQIDTIFAHFA